MTNLIKHKILIKNPTKISLIKPTKPSQNNLKSIKVKMRMKEKNMRIKEDINIKNVQVINQTILIRRITLGVIPIMAIDHNEY